MDKQQAQEFIKKTFESPFDKVCFTNFIKNLLNRIDDAPFIYQGNYIPDAYKQYIKKLERIGKFSDGENRIDILVITLQKETSLERARTMQRNFIAWYLNGSRGGKMKEAALAAFVSPGKEDWRFSLVKMDYKFEQTKSGRMKVKEEFTPARRWSFLVGENEKSHTAQIRLVNILANDEQDPTLKEIEKAFDIETVTKEFFLEYRELFLHTKEELDGVVEKDPKIKADFEAKSVDTVNFAKKLLGQIIFLYFLQKKGWFGVGRDDDWDTGSKHFLRELFEKKHGDYNNFFNDILEPLFYDALRNDRSHDDGYYSRFNCKIPFLNGGLFDPIGNYDWVHTDIIIPDKLFSNNVKTKEGDPGTGILDVFDRYNFTVKEDEPLEKEVAIDPELLGKSYEKFNAIRPDNYDEFKKALKSGKKGEENKFNKKFGVYYTPREIVHYMCQQSLINYLSACLAQAGLATELSDSHCSSTFRHSRESGNSVVSKEDIEILIHTGEQVSENEAIFLEKEQKIKKGEQKTTSIKTKLPDSIRKNAKLLDDKLAEITVCDPAVGSGAFPVGMMSEIVKARNVLTTFLSLRGTQATKQSQFDDKRTIYNFKRQCIEHSLYGVDIDPGAVEIAKLRLWLSLVVDEDDIKNIKPLPNLDYRIMQGNSLISEFMGISFDEDENKNLKQNIDDLGIEIKEFDKQIKDKEKQFLRYYNKTKKQDQNLSNKLDELTNRKNDLKKNQTQLIKKLNNPQDETPEIIDIISEFQKKKNDFLNESNVTKKLQLKNEVDDLLVKIFETKLRTQKPDYFNRLKNIENKYSVVRNEKQRDEFVKQDKEKLNKEFGFDPELAEKQLKEFTSGRKIKPFFLWNLYFSEVFLSEAKSASGGHNKGGFDVVIANPPYGIVYDKELKQPLLKLYSTFSRNNDIYVAFYERGLTLARDRSFLIYISPNTFLNGDYFKTLRKMITCKTNICEVIDFKELPVFDDPTVFVCTFGCIKNSHITFPYEFDLKVAQNSDYRYELSKVEISGYSASSFKPKNKIYSKIIATHDVDLVDNLFYVKDVGFNYWTKGRGKKRDGTSIGSRVFYSGKQKNKKDIPFIKGKDVFRYGNNCPTNFLRHDFNKFLNPSVDTLRFSLNFLETIPKIIYRQTASRIIAALDIRGNYLDKTVHLVAPKSVDSKLNLKYVLALLNSTLFHYIYKYICQEREGRAFAQVKTTYIKQLPIKKTVNQQNSIIGLVDRILSITKSEDYLQNSQKQAKVKTLEAEIDRLVYKLYNLTPEEIKIVEGENAKTKRNKKPMYQDR